MRLDVLRVAVGTALVAAVDRGEQAVLAIVEQAEVERTLGRLGEAVAGKVVAAATGERLEFAVQQAEPAGQSQRTGQHHRGVDLEPAQRRLAGVFGPEQQPVAALLLDGNLLIVPADVEQVRIQADPAVEPHRAQRELVVVRVFGIERIGRVVTVDGRTAGPVATLHDETPADRVALVPANADLRQKRIVVGVGAVARKRRGVDGRADVLRRKARLAKRLGVVAGAEKNRPGVIQAVFAVEEHRTIVDHLVQAFEEVEVERREEQVTGTLAFLLERVQAGDQVEAGARPQTAQLVGIDDLPVGCEIKEHVDVVFTEARAGRLARFAVGRDELDGQLVGKHLAQRHRPVARVDGEHRRVGHRRVGPAREKVRPVRDVRAEPGAGQPLGVDVGNERREAVKRVRLDQQLDPPVLRVVGVQVVDAGIRIRQEAVRLVAVDRRAKRHLLVDDGTANREAEPSGVVIRVFDAPAARPRIGRVGGSNMHRAGQGIPALHRRLHTAVDLHLLDIEDAGGAGLDTERRLENPVHVQAADIRRQRQVLAAEVDATDREIALVGDGRLNIGRELVEVRDVGKRQAGNHGLIVDGDRRIDVPQRLCPLLTADDDLVQRLRCLVSVGHRIGDKREQRRDQHERRLAMTSKHATPQIRKALRMIMIMILIRNSWYGSTSPPS